EARARVAAAPMKALAATATARRAMRRRSEVTKRPSHLVAVAHGHARTEPRGVQNPSPARSHAAVTRPHTLAVPRQLYMPPLTRACDADGPCRRVPSCGVPSV